MSVDEIRDYLFIIAKEFATTDTDELILINSLISQTMLTHNETILSYSYKEAVSYFVAHQLFTSGFTPASGSGSSSTTQEVLKKKAGNVEITYSDSTVKKTQKISSGIESSKYGAMYQTIMDRVLIAPRWY